MLLKICVFENVIFFWKKN